VCDSPFRAYLAERESPNYALLIPPMPKSVDEERNPLLRGQANKGGADEEGDHPLPETLRCTGRIPVPGGG